MNTPGETAPLPDLGGAQVRARIGIAAPANAAAAQALKRATSARVCAGRAGPRPRTEALLRFQADLARSRDAVLGSLAEDWLARSGLLAVRTRVADKDEYLRRPDLGRRLADDAVRTLTQRCVPGPEVQLVVADGLSTEAITANFADIVPPILRGLEDLGLRIGTPFFVHHARVKVGDEIGELLSAKVVILLIGERPGLGQSESLSCYMAYRPTRRTVESERSCLSNIHRGGTPPVEAAAVIVELAARMLREQASGIALERALNRSTWQMGAPQ